MSQNTFDIFDDTAGRHVGQQEKATRRLIESLTERSGGDLDPFATTLCASLLSLAQNIDTQRNAGKEISRNIRCQILENTQRLQQCFTFSFIRNGSITGPLKYFGGSDT